MYYLENLYDAAKRANRRPMKPFEYLHRGIESKHLDDLLRDRYIATKLKNWTGHDQNPANGQEVARGVFFSPQTRGTYPPVNKSPFGDKLLLFNVEDLISPEHHNLYFSDYYCHRPEVHYLTLFVSRNQTEANTFCQENLLQMNMFDNPFFKYDLDNKKFLELDSLQLWIEIFLTEPVSLDLLQDWQDVQHTFWPRGMVDLGCNESCPCCNPR